MNTILACKQARELVRNTAAAADFIGQTILAESRHFVTMQLEKRFPRRRKQRPDHSEALAPLGGSDSLAAEFD